MKLKLLDYKDLPELPAGSNLEFYNDSVYVVDDDASDLVVLNKKWQVESVNKLLNGEVNIVPKSKSYLVESDTKGPHINRSIISISTK